MKKFVSALFVISYALLAYSDDYYWGNDKGTWWGNWSVNWSDENHVEKAHKPYATDNAIFDVNFMDYKINAEISTSEETVKDIIFQNHYTETDGVRTSKGHTITSTNNANPTLTVTGNIIKYRGESNGDSTISSEKADNRLTLIVSGTEGDSSTGNIIVGTEDDPTTGMSGHLVLGANTSGGALAKIEVAGDIVLNKTSSIYVNVGTGSGSSENPDMVVKGIVNMAGSDGQNPNFYVNNQVDGVVKDTYLKIGGLTGNGSFVTNYGSYGNTTVELTNAAGVSCTYYGFIKTNSENSSIKVIMNGEGTQSLLPTWEPDLHFSFNGLEVRKGTMEIFSVASVGDIELTGGNLKIMGANAQYSTDSSFSQKPPQLHGDNLIWTSGKISVSVGMDSDGNAQAAMLYLTGALMKGEGFTKAEFEFSGDVLFYLDEWIQIMSFEDGAEDFDASDFVANTFNDEWGAKFKIDNNALYVMYTAIPEPAAAAAVLGIFAVAVMLVRKNLLKKTNQLF